MPTSWVPRHLKVDILTDFDYVWMNLEAQRGVHTSYVGGLGATSHPGLEIFRKMRAGEMAQAGRVIVVTTSMCNVPQCATCSEGVCGAAGQDWHEQPERHHAEVSEDSVFLMSFVVRKSWGAVGAPDEAGSDHVSNFTQHATPTHRRWGRIKLCKELTVI